MNTSPGLAPVGYPKYYGEPLPGKFFMASRNLHSFIHGEPLEGAKLVASNYKDCFKTCLANEECGGVNIMPKTFSTLNVVNTQYLTDTTTDINVQRAKALATADAAVKAAMDPKAMICYAVKYATEEQKEEGRVEYTESSQDVEVSFCDYKHQYRAILKSGTLFSPMTHRILRSTAFHTERILSMKKQTERIQIH